MTNCQIFARVKIDVLPDAVRKDYKRYFQRMFLVVRHRRAGPDKSIRYLENPCPVITASP